MFLQGLLRSFKLASCSCSYVAVRTKGGSWVGGCRGCDQPTGRLSGSYSPFVVKFALQRAFQTKIKKTNSGNRNWKWSQEMQATKVSPRKGWKLGPLSLCLVCVSHSIPLCLIRATFTRTFIPSSDFATLAPSSIHLSVHHGQNVDLDQL